jgi:outer membrane protein
MTSRSVSIVVSKLLLSIAAAVALVPGASAQEGPIKIGYVDLQKILRSAAPAKAAEARLNSEFGKREKELQEMQANLKAKSDRLDRDAAVLPEADRVRRQREIAEIDKDFQRRQREYREDLNQKANEETAQVIEKANVVIRAIAAAEKFDLIFQEAVFFSSRVDITEKVLKALSAGK